MTFSIRQHLKNQGVDSPDGMKAHLNFILLSLQSNPHLNLRQYRVNPLHPNSVERIQQG